MHHRTAANIPLRAHLRTPVNCDMEIYNLLQRILVHARKACPYHEQIIVDISDRINNADKTKNISTSNQITKNCPLYVALLTINNTPNIDGRLWEISALIVTAVILSRIHTGNFNHSSFSEALLMVRQLVTGKPKKYRSGLSINPNRKRPLPSEHHNWEYWHREIRLIQSAQTTDNTHRSKLSALINVFDYGFGDKTPSTKTFINKKKEKKLFDAIDVEGATVITEAPAVSGGRVDSKYGRHPSDDRIRRQHIRLSDKKRRYNGHRKAMAAQSIKCAIQRKEQCLAIDSQFLCSASVQAIIESTEANDMASIMLFLSLVLGRSIEKLLGMDFNGNNRRNGDLNSQWNLSKGLLSIRQFTFSGSDNLSNREIRPSKYYDIKIPEIDIISAFIKKLKKINSFDCNNIKKLNTEISLHISKLNKKLSNELTQHRVANHLSHKLSSNGVDECIIKLLTGEGDPNSYMGMYYASIEKSAISSAWNQWLLEIIDYEAQIIPTAGFVGSHHGMRTQESMDLFDKLRADLENSKIRLSTAQRHNVYTTFVLLAFLFTTSHRPSNSPFSSCLDIDLTRQTVYISDKSKYFGQVRCNPILDSIKDIAIQYNHYLGNLNRKLRVSGGNVCTHIYSILQGKSVGYFFYIDSTGTNTIEVTEQRLQDQISKYCNLVVNGHRHICRSRLIGMVDSRLIDDWIGHSGFGKEYFDKYSCKSMSDINQISQALESIFSNYDFSPIKNMEI